VNIAITAIRKEIDLPTAWRPSDRPEDPLDVLRHERAEQVDDGDQTAGPEDYGSRLHGIQCRPMPS
jgi:hypothetical protein